MDDLEIFAIRSRPSSKETHTLVVYKGHRYLTIDRGGIVSAGVVFSGVLNKDPLDVPELLAILKEWGRGIPWLLEELSTSPFTKML